MATVLIGGGSRSGKSRYALELARRCGSRLALIATAQAFDAEMEARIRAHREERRGEFVTIEEPLDIGAALGARAAEFDAVVVDCLTLWLSNLMLAPEPADLSAAANKLAEAAAASPAKVILVTNEVGCGIVPGNELARRFRDEAGRLNSRMASIASEAYWMAFGCPLRVK